MFSPNQVWNGLPGEVAIKMAHICQRLIIYWGLPGSSNGKESACNAGDSGLILRLGEEPLKKGMATHSSILAWRIPWTEEPGRLQTMGSQRVRHDGATNTFTLFLCSRYCCILLHIWTNVPWNKNYYLHFTDKETKAQRGWATRPRTPSWAVEAIRSESKQFGSKICMPKPSGSPLAGNLPTKHLWLWQ